MYAKIFFFCILKDFLDGREKRRDFGLKKPVSQVMLSSRYSGHLVKQIFSIIRDATKIPPLRGASPVNGVFRSLISSVD